MEVIDCKSLMIGDWVMLTDPINNGEKVQVKEIHGDGYITVVGGITKMYEPIPLTVEILEKNGFIIKKKWAQLGNFGNSPLIMWHFVDDPILRNYNTELEIHQNDTGKVHVRIPCKYVHELQRALRLCHINKEITL